MQTESNSTKPGSKPATDAASGISLELNNFLADVEDMVKSTTTLSGEDLAAAKAKLGKRIAAAKASVEEMGEAIAQQARKTVTVTDQYVHQQPWNAVGIGAAAGFLLGFVLARRI